MDEERKRKAREVQSGTGEQWVSAKQYRVGETGCTGNGLQMDGEEDGCWALRNAVKEHWLV